MERRHVMQIIRSNVMQIIRSIASSDRPPRLNPTSRRRVGCKRSRRSWQHRGAEATGTRIGDTGKGQATAGKDDTTLEGAGDEEAT